MIQVQGLRRRRRGPHAIPAGVRAGASDAPAIAHHREQLA
jgi:hypothetical protein